MSDDIQQETSANWLDLMRRGDYEKAWEYSDAVLKSRAGKPCWHLPRHLQYIWNGARLEGKRVLVRCYHGLGDTIQFIRYMPLLKAIASEVIVWAQPDLLPVLKTMHGIDRLMPLHNGIPEASFDVDIEIMELPHIFRTTTASIRSEIPYLHVEPASLPDNKKELTVGLVWKAGDWDERRSIPFSLLRPLAEIPYTRFYILQSGAGPAGWRNDFGVYPGECSLSDYARIVRALDLLISVDSMPVHLAGALGIPVWNMLHADADWRWLENREDSPWYPTMRLFRQKRPGEWEHVINLVASELKKLTEPT